MLDPICYCCTRAARGAVVSIDPWVLDAADRARGSGSERHIRTAVFISPHFRPRNRRVLWLTNTNHVVPVRTPPPPRCCCCSAPERIPARVSSNVSSRVSLLLLPFA
ncbi:hypothetical protein F2P81_014991 [Scophthalmus maximus]|uniref:Uncharacterized protein n=1 Tax=Scophthalmus maximus TaxID=52904 RepID=A0A6A4SNP5_SCOMX|nr:hypothetical protein F2P81_014991 [Scophthalmus maximus]